VLEPPQLLLLARHARVLVLLLALPDVTVWNVLSWALPLLLLLSALCCASCALWVLLLPLLRTADALPPVCCPRALLLRWALPGCPAAQLQQSPRRALCGSARHTLVAGAAAHSRMLECVNVGISESG
jgi:hypothetical protein